VVSQQDSKKIRTRLVRFDLRTHRETELKGDEFSIAVAVSPDSKQIAYLVQEQPGAESYLAVMPASGGPAREVFRGSPWNDASRYNTLAWTPDRRYLLFVRGTTGDGPNVLWRVPVSGGPAEQMGLTIPGKVKSPQIDPLGRQLFFSANENSPSEIWTLENFVSQTAVAGK
jgi:dipeptidyl aminopeptidase/acylaminoacyl peptidase